MSISRYSQRTLLTGTPCACDGEPSDREASPAIRFSLLAALAAKLLVVELLDCLDRRLELLLVGAHHHKDAEVDLVHVRIREQALHDAETEGTMRCRARQGHRARMGESVRFERLTRTAREKNSSTLASCAMCAETCA